MANQSCCAGSSARKGTASGCCGAAAIKPGAVAGSRKRTGAREAQATSGGSPCGCAGREEKYIAVPAEQAQTPAGTVPRVPTKLAFTDILGAWKCRWSIGRMEYAVKPGLYCAGNPGEQSPVLVSANYKLSFDRLRKELSGLDAWILVLDTDGINVWCAAGKGTFGTEELVYRIKETGLSKVVSHRTLILPQLGAAGVAAHEVRRRSGFHVEYGPVRARDIKAYLAAGMKATEEMRTMRFPFGDRLALTPVELVAAIKPVVIAFGVMFMFNALGLGRYGIIDLYALLGAVFIGAVVTPALLPWIPGRAFSFKGFLTGFLWAAGVNLINGFPAAPEYGFLKAWAYMLLLPALSSFLAMNFTGSSTFTSLSGVDREMKIALPLMIASAGLGIILMLAGDFVRALG